MLLVGCSDFRDLSEESSDWQKKPASKVRERKPFLVTVYQEVLTTARPHLDTTRISRTHPSNDFLSICPRDSCLRKDSQLNLPHSIASAWTRFPHQVPRGSGTLAINLLRRIIEGPAWSSMSSISAAGGGRFIKMVEQHQDVLRQAEKDHCASGGVGTTTTTTTTLGSLPILLYDSNMEARHREGRCLFSTPATPPGTDGDVAGTIKTESQARSAKKVNKQLTHHLTPQHTHSSSDPTTWIQIQDALRSHSPPGSDGRPRQPPRPPSLH